MCQADAVLLATLLWSLPLNSYAGEFKKTSGKMWGALETVGSEVSEPRTKGLMEL